MIFPPPITTPDSSPSGPLMLTTLFLLGPAVLVYVIYQIVTQALPRFFLVPPQHWQDKILKVINHPKPIYLKVGAKRSSFRRRLITASVQPSFYTNFLSNKLQLHPKDTENKDGFFMNAMKRRAPNDASRKVIYGFFHPYANNGGGGEKVLWQAVHATLLEDPRNIVAIYTVNVDAKPLDILQKAADKFAITGIDSKRVVFIYLRRYALLIDSNYWKHFTLLGQLFGSAVLGLEAMYELSPDIWIDTQGLPGSYLLANWVLKEPIVAYVHYPIIQPDMFSKLKFQKFSDLVTMSFSASDVKQAIKFLYWTALYSFYMYLGSMVDITFANGTWTLNHIKNIWYLNPIRGREIALLYPPCSAEVPKGVADTVVEKVKPRKNNMIYVGQFRPEKRHLLVLEQYSKFLAKFRDSKLPLSSLPTITFLGSCRTPTDSDTLDKLYAQVRKLDISDYVEFVVDCSYEELKEHLATAKFGLNAMWNEHFGISVVEYLSFGVVPIVHASAGPLLDILSTDTPSKTWENDLGFFFKSEEDPDYSGVKQGDNLDFFVGDETWTYPTLSALLTKLFIKSPETISDANLAKKRALAKGILEKKFSSKIFTTKWMEFLRSVAIMERTYRENRRDGIDGVH